MSCQTVKLLEHTHIQTQWNEPYLIACMLGGCPHIYITSWHGVQPTALLSSATPLREPHLATIKLRYTCLMVGSRVQTRSFSMNFRATDQAPCFELSRRMESLGGGDAP